jgi:hypothetical protein
LSPTSKRAAPTERPEVVIRFAEGDADVVTIHRFLCVVAGPTLPGPIDPKDSATEVWRVVNEDVALMAMSGDSLVGSIGLVNPKFWWGKARFFANRWFFSVPGFDAGAPLLKEAIEIAKASGLELHIIDENRQRLKIFNKSKNRQDYSHVFR